MSEKEKEEKHPSYGMISFNRTGDSTRRLFGSALRNHSSTIRMRLCRATRYHKYGSDWYMGNEELVEVELTAAQFATLLTSMNVGSGVPCTIRRLDGPVENPPDEVTENERVQGYFEDSMKELAARLGTVATTIEQTLQKKTVTMKDRDVVKHTLDMLIQQVEKNLPFVREQFEESTERLVANAKAEIDAFVTSVVTTTGLDMLRANALKSDEDKRTLIGLEPASEDEP